MDKHITKVLSILLVCALCFCFFSSCSYSVNFDKDRKTALYKGNKYIFYNEGTSLTYWYPTPSPDQIEKIGKTEFELSAWALKPIYATKEDEPNFIIVSYRGKNISEHFSYAFIREDIKLVSPFEITFDNMLASDNYYDGQTYDLKGFASLPSGIKFDDMIDKSITLSDVHANEIDEYYCTLFSTYPGIDYLRCTFTIVIIDGEYYLKAYHQPNEASYYLFNKDLLQ